MIYSVVGTVQDMRELVDLAAAGKVKSHIGRTAPLSELPQVFDELASGELRGAGRDHRPRQLREAADVTDTAHGLAIVTGGARGLGRGDGRRPLGPGGSSTGWRSST